MNEIFSALTLLEEFTGKAWLKKNNKKFVTKEACRRKGKELLMQVNEIINELEIIAEGFENSKRSTIIIKVQEAYNAYREMILYYGLTELIELLTEENRLNGQYKIFDTAKRSQWVNVGGQLMPVEELDSLREKIKTNVLKSWDEVHACYTEAGKKYPVQKLKHALASLLEIENLSAKEITAEKINEWLDRAVSIASSVTKRISESREKDYTNPFRKMIYDSDGEMNKVLGGFDENSFIKQKQKDLKSFKKKIESLKMQKKAAHLFSTTGTQRKNTKTSRPGSHKGR